MKSLAKAPMSQTAERYSRIQELFDAVVDLPSDDRAAILEKQCGGDATLRQEVETLLAADAQTGSFGEEPVFPLPEDLFPDEAEEPFAGRRFGVYEIIREVGRGGLGAVYLAARADDEYRKEVAIKLIRRGLDTDDILRRFRTERQILAQLDHPNIARLLDGGTTDDGLPYFVMEYVKGEPINAYCDLHNLNPSDRLQLFRKVCAAVTYAHQNLVVHRDLKPSNILVTSDGDPKLLDFGIAKLLSADDEAFTQTAPGLRAMTPDYASPEQIKGEKITTASDVYSLGVLLYELLTGQRPYRLKTRTPEEFARAITEQEPERPSSAITNGDPSSVVSRHSSFPKGDLDNIVLMALRKEPERRYSSVAQFSEDIRRHLEGRPVVAHKDTFTYRAQKFIERNKIGVAAALTIFLILLTGIIVTLFQAERVVAERNRARKEAAKASRINTFLQNVLAFSDPSWLSSNPNKDREATVSEALETASRRVETELADQPEVAAAVHFTVGWTYKALGKLDKAEPHLRAAFDIRRRVLGGEDQDTAQSMVGLAELFQLRGNSKEAEAMTREAVSIYRKAQTKGVVDVKWFAVGLSNLSLILYATKGQDAVCEALTREAIAVSSPLTGTDRAPVPIFYNNLANLRNEQGDLDGAIRYTRNAIEEQARLPGDSRLGMDNFLNSLGVLLATKGEFPEAERALLEAVEIAVKTVGENHRSTALYLTNLSGCHSGSGNFHRAREVANRAIEIQQRSIPETHPDYIRSWLSLGNALNGLGELAQAEEFLRRALGRAREKLPPNSRYIPLAAGSLGENLTRQKRLFPEAEELLQFSYRELKARLGDGHPQTAKAAERLRKLEQIVAE
jgi:eukaryotic-like serine/threonine-protein kinase